MPSLTLVSPYLPRKLSVTYVHYGNSEVLGAGLGSATDYIVKRRGALDNTGDGSSSLIEPFGGRVFD